MGGKGEKKETNAGTTNKREKGFSESREQDLPWPCTLYHTNRGKKAPLLSCCTLCEGEVDGRGRK